MIDKNFCMSSFLAFRYVEKPDFDFFPWTHHKAARIPSKNETVPVFSEDDLDKELHRQFAALKNKRVGLLLSGGMDSACLAAYLPKGSDAYTFRFLGGQYDSEELQRAITFADYCGLNLHFVDIDFEKIKAVLGKVMKTKGAPVHSIEPQLFIAAEQMKKDGIDLIVYGDAADYVFYGMDGLLARDWSFDDFVKRSIYIEPSVVLKEPADVLYLYERYRLPDDKIDFVAFYDKVVTEESYGSYANAFECAEMPYLDPYEHLRLGKPVDLERVRRGDSKYFVRSLFRAKYMGIPLPEKHPMPRPVDDYFRDWKGPSSPEFKKDIDIKLFNGNQRWLLWCLDEFLKANR